MSHTIYLPGNNSSTTSGSSLSQPLVVPQLVRAGSDGSGSEDSDAHSGGRDTPLKPLSLGSTVMTMNAAGGKPEQQGDYRAAALYMLISILLILFNKACFSYYEFKAPNVLTLSQNICSLAFLLLCKHAKLGIEFHNFNWRNFRKMLPLGLTFIAYMVFGMIAMKVVNIPMYTTLRRTTVVFVMLLEYIISRKTSTLTIKFSVVLMILGALVAGVRDLNFDLIAYAIVVVYNLCTALYLVLINQISSGEKNKVNTLPGTVPASQVVQRLEKYDFMFYNNLISIPLLVCIIAATGEIEAARASPYWRDTGFLVSLLASSVLAFALNYTIFWNTAVNSALTQTVSGQAKDVVVVFLGFAMFNDAHLDLINLLGVCIGFLGSIVYAMTKIVRECSIEYVALKFFGWRIASSSSTSSSATGSNTRTPSNSICHGNGGAGSGGVGNNDTSSPPKPKAEAHAHTHGLLPFSASSATSLAHLQQQYEPEGTRASREGIPLSLLEKVKVDDVSTDSEADQMLPHSHSHSHAHTHAHPFHHRPGHSHQQAPHADGLGLSHHPHTVPAARRDVS